MANIRYLSLKNKSLDELERIAKKEGLKIDWSHKKDIKYLEDVHGINIEQEIAMILAEMIIKARKAKQKAEANKRTKEYLEAVSDKVGEDEEENNDSVSEEPGKD